jgi:hypothetical protein
MSIEASANEVLRRERARSRRVLAIVIQSYLSGLEKFSEEFREVGLDPEKVVLALRELLVALEQ